MYHIHIWQVCSQCISYLVRWRENGLNQCEKGVTMITWLDILVSGSSFVIGYLVAMHVTLSNFPDNMKGTVVSVLNVGWWTGQGLFNYFYTLTRTGKLPTVGTIFLILAVCIFVIKGLASICVRPVELDDDCSALLKCERDDIPDSGALDDTNKSDPKDQDEGEGNAVVKVLGLGLFLQLDFHCVFWGFMLGNSSAVIYLGNVATIAVSLNLSEYIDTALITAPIAGLLVTVTCGCLSDRTRLVFPRAMYAVIGCLSNAIMFAISAVYGTKVAVFFTTVVVIFGTNGIFYCISSPIIGERFGMVHFKRNWGLISMCGSAFALVTTAVFGLLYESNIENEETTACIGLDCLQGVFIVGAVLSLAAAGCYLVLARRFIARCCRRRE